MIDHKNHPQNFSSFPRINDFISKMEDDSRIVFDNKIISNVKDPGIESFTLKYGNYVRKILVISNKEGISEISEKVEFTPNLDEIRRRKNVGFFGPSSEISKIIKTEEPFKSITPHHVKNQTEKQKANKMQNENNVSANKPGAGVYAPKKYNFTTTRNLNFDNNVSKVRPNFSIRILNFPLITKNDDIRNLLDRLGIRPQREPRILMVGQRIQRFQGNVIVSFFEEETSKIALKKLNGYTYSSNLLMCEKLEPKPNL